MCNLIYISTDSDQDLASLGSNQFKYERMSGEELAKIGPLLSYPNKWFLECQYGGCSCHFRHLLDGSDFDFGPVADWLPEDEDDVESTAAVYDSLAVLVNAGARVDILDTYEGEPVFKRDVEVRLSEVKRNDFRFWEACRFELLP